VIVKVEHLPSERIDIPTGKNITAHYTRKVEEKEINVGIVNKSKQYSKACCVNSLRTRQETYSGKDDANFLLMTDGVHTANNSQFVMN
jgi:hypothetical protein